MTFANQAAVELLHSSQLVLPITNSSLSPNLDYLSTTCGMSITLEHSEAAGNLLSMDRLTKLRRAETQEEIDAGNWFFGEFLECVAGKRGWGKQKYFQKVSTAVDRETNEALVTVSDEAFALLMLENYREKWLLRYQEACSSAAGRRRSTDKNKRIDGKYTSSINGHTEFGGWNKRGIRKFNYYCRLAGGARQAF
jgi:hypothetical protein